MVLHILSRSLASTRASSLRPFRRCLSIQTDRPHAYLTPWMDFPAPDSRPSVPPEELEGVMCLVMDRKETKNALSVRMVNEMRDSLAKLSSPAASLNSRILLLLTPHENTFCSGADLRERKGMTQTQVDAFLLNLRGLLDDLEGMKIPTVAVVDGFAMGGGCELALGCDMRVGGPNTKISLPEVKLGIIPGAGGTQRATKLLGVAKAKELIFTGRTLDGVEAERIGLLNSCAHAPSTALEQALILSKQMLTSAPLALAAAKQAINAAPYLPLQSGLDLERSLYEPLLKSEDRMEGLRAFAEKRPAKFQGR